MNMIKKSLATTLAAITLCLPFTNIALAAPGPHHAGPAQRTESRQAPPQHKMQPNRGGTYRRPAPPPSRNHRPVYHRDGYRRPAPPPPPPRGYRNSHSSHDRDVIAGVVIGGIIGAIIANNAHHDY